MSLHFPAPRPWRRSLALVSRCPDGSVSAGMGVTPTADRRPDEGEIRAGLRCGRSCECNRPRGKVHCPLHDTGASGSPDLSVSTKNGTVLVICRVCDKSGQPDLIPALQDRGLW